MKTFNLYLPALIGILAISHLFVANCTAQPNADFSFSYGNGGCTPDTVAFTNTSTGAVSYRWVFGDGSPPFFGFDTVHAYTWANTFMVTLTAYDMMGDSDVVTKPVLINQTPWPGFAGFWYNPMSPVCPGIPIQFNSFPVFMPPTIGHLWVFGDGDSSVASNPAHSYSAEDSFQVIHIRYAQCGSDTFMQIVTVDSSGRPNANVSAWPNPICPNQDLEIFNNTQGASSYLWVFGDGDSSNVFDPVKSYSAVGNYNMQLFAFNNCGSDTFAMLINVVDTITPTVSAWVNDDSICPNNPVNFTGWSNYAVSYYWDFGDGFNSLMQNPSHAYSSTGTYIAVFTATNACGNSKSRNLTIRVLNNLPPETVNFYTTPWSSCAGSSICPGTPVMFNNTSSDLGTSYWNFDDGYTSALNNPTHTFNDTGAFNVKLVVTSSCGGKDSVTKCVRVRSDVVPSAWFCINPPMCFPEPVCVGSVVMFQNNASDTSNVYWDFGDGANSTLVNPTHVYADTGNYIITLTVINPCGNNATTSQALSVVTSGSPPEIMNLWINPQSACPGSPVNMNAWSMTANSYKFFFGDGESDSVQFGFSTHGYLNPGAYQVTVVAYNGCGTDTITGQVTIKNGPSPDFTFSSGCQGAPINFTDNSSPVPNSWAWDFGDGDTSSAQNPLHTFASAGSYNVLLIVSDSGCNSQVTKEVVIGIDMDVTKVDASCGNPNGEATATVNSGIPPLTYSWSGGQTTSTITGIVAGTYTVTVTGGTGCTASAAITVNNVGGVPSTAPLSASATPDTACAGGTTTLTVAGGSLGTGANWIWHRDSCNGPFVTSGSPVVVSPPSAITYFVRAEGICNTTACVSVSVAVTPPATVNAGADDAVCAGNPYTLSGTRGGSATSSTWSTSGDGIFNNTSLLNATYTAGVLDLMMGSVTLTLTSNNPPGPCPAVMDAMVLTINMPATASAGADATICSGSTYALSGSRGGSATSSTWTTSGDGTFNNPALTNAIYTPGPNDIAMGSATLTITTNDPPGPCPSVFDQMVLTIDPAATANAGPNASVCGTSSYTLSGIIGGSATSASWSTSGSGTFNDNTLLNATYTLSNPDKAMGGVTLTLTTNNPPGPCGAASDAMVLSYFASAPNVTTSANNVSCNGDCDGDATANVVGGAAPYTYQWDAGAGNQTTSAATALCAGSFDVFIWDSNNCRDTGTANITEPAALAITTGSIPASCGLNDGATYATITGGVSPYLYLWDDPGAQTNDTASALGIGTYNVTSTDANGCTITGSASVVNLGAQTVTVDSVFDALCNGDNSGAVAVTVTGGTLPYTYLWSTGSTNDTLQNVAAGNYTVTVTDASSCVASVSASVGEPSAISLTASVISDAHCGQSDGEADVSATGGTGTYTYLWSNSATTSSINLVLSGNYTVTVTDANICSATSSVSISDLPGGIVSIASSNNVSCNSDCDGDATASAAGGNAPYTYVWNTLPAQSAITATGLCAAVYEIILTDADNCTDTVSVTITEPAVLSVITSVMDASCAGSSDGSADATASGGTSPYAYLWDDPASQTTSSATGLQAGIYSVTVTDANGCTAPGSDTIGEPAALSLIMSSADASCGGSDGSATVTAAGGSGSYSYLWDVAAGGQTTSAATGLASGTYAVTVTDGNGCTKTGLATVNNAGAPSLFIASSNISCNGANDGSASASVSGGTPPYTYMWSNSATTSSISFLPSSIYTVTLTDAGGCVVSDSVTITEPAVLSVSVVSVTDLNCYGDYTGAADINVTGGTLPYSYLWSGGETSEDISNAAAGNYDVTATDGNSCTATTSAVITEPALLVVTTTSTDASCAAAADGGMDATASGGTAPYSYQWNDPASQTTSSATGLAAGIYSITVSDFNGCTFTQTDTVNAPAALVLSISSMDATCGTSDGSAMVSVTGGTLSYTYLWNTGNTTDSLLNVSVGSYTVTVTDGNGCTETGSAAVNNVGAPSLVLSSTNVTCNGANDGTATASVTGGAPPYTYLWSNSETTSSINLLPAAIYTVTVTDTLGCITTESVSITEPAALIVSVASVSNLNCYGDNNGAVDINVSGGVNPYTFLWSDGTSAEDISNAIAGNYDVTVTDGNLCTSTASSVITEPAVLVAIVSNVNSTSCGLCDGSADISPSGGVLPYTYLWDDPGAQTTSTAVGLCASNYNVTVTDANSCFVTVAVSVPGPGGLSSSISSSSDATCYSSCDGDATVTASGGTSPYTYLWDDLLGQDSTTATGLCAGVYMVTVTDNNGCTTLSSAAVNEPTELVLSIDSTDATCGSCPDGSASLTVNGGTLPYTYVWSNGKITEDIDSVLPATYYVTVTDANGCTIADSIEVDFVVEAGDIIVQSKGLRVFPNPVTEIAHLSWDKMHGKEVTAAIYNSTGQQIFLKTGTISFTGLKLNVSQLPEGVYHVIVCSGRNYLTGRFVVER